MSPVSQVSSVDFIRGESAVLPKLLIIIVLWSTLNWNVYLEDRESDDGELVGSYLHPDHAYTGGSRRGSSQSEQLEVETYELSQDFSRSLPGSRRSSFQKEGEKQGIVVGVIPGRV